MGLFLSIILLFVFPIVFKLMNIENYEDYNAKNIFNKAWDILSYVFNIKDIIKESQKQNMYRGQYYYDIDFSDNTSNYEL